MLKIPEMTMRERAFGYPYDAPQGAYLLQNAYQLDLSAEYDFSDRVAVLSVGSNRAPAQLYRKFGGEAEVPVTPVKVQDCDIVHVANLADYGAVPLPCLPVYWRVYHLEYRLVIAGSPLAVMHTTESLGQAYDWVEWVKRGNALVPCTAR